MKGKEKIANQLCKNPQWYLASNSTAPKKSGPLHPVFSFSSPFFPTLKGFLRMQAHKVDLKKHKLCIIGEFSIIQVRICNFGKIGPNKKNIQLSKG